jgi:hypothetical protein
LEYKGRDENRALFICVPMIGGRRRSFASVDISSPLDAVSLSQTLSSWQLIENQAILSWDEGSLQTYWLDARRSAPVAGNARGRDLDNAAANKRPAAGCSKETLLQYHRPIDIRWSLSVVS